MRIVLRQTFPLGRFHATPWAVNPFDDPHGEWPPSPWRLVRAVAARWYQWAREADQQPDYTQLEKLLGAFCASSFSFHLPILSSKGRSLRQYFPQEFGWHPAEKKKAGARSYNTSLAQDNYWCIPPDADSAVWWMLDGADWNDSLLTTLDRCLERMIYFGRAESFTRIERISTEAPEPNCTLKKARSAAGAGAVPVLMPCPDATREQIEQTTGNLNPTTPPGAHVMYALRPSRSPVKERPKRTSRHRETNFLQFAVGWNVAPRRQVIVRLTSCFRGAVIKELLRIKSGDRKITWSRASIDIRNAVMNMTGKDASGKPLKGPHQHTEFLVWCEDDQPTRMLVWRDQIPFDEDEQTAILRATSRELAWAGNGPDTWRVKLIPLDRAVPPPPGFDGAFAKVWESITSYVPPRHHLRKGKPRSRESLTAQIHRELTLRGFLGSEHVSVEQIGAADWVAVHMPRNSVGKQVFIGDRRGYRLRLTFPEPVRGPLRLGHSSSFGLGLFRPIISGGE